MMNSVIVFKHQAALRKKLVKEKKKYLKAKFQYILSISILYLLFKIIGIKLLKNFNIYKYNSKYHKIHNIICNIVSTNYKFLAKKPKK